MITLEGMGAEALRALERSLTAEFEAICGRTLNLDLTRGKPATDQLELSNGLDGILQGDYRAEDGTDVRNYGTLLGIPEARRLGGLIM
ncbi:MAG: aminotransferase, partial [Gammaproteobacteria bacterium]